MAEQKHKHKNPWVLLNATMGIATLSLVLIPRRPTCDEVAGCNWKRSAICPSGPPAHLRWIADVLKFQVLEMQIELRNFHIPLPESRFLNFKENQRILKAKSLVVGQRCTTSSLTRFNAVLRDADFITLGYKSRSMEDVAYISITGCCYSSKGDCSRPVHPRRLRSQVLWFQLAIDQNTRNRLVGDAIARDMRHALGPDSVRLFSEFLVP